MGDRSSTAFRLAAACLLASAAALPGAEPAPKVQKDKDLEPKVAALVVQLADERFEVREQAVSALIALGPGATPFLEPQAGHEDAEVAERVRRVLARLRIFKWPPRALKDAAVGEWVEYNWQYSSRMRFLRYTVVRKDQKEVAFSLSYANRPQVECKLRLDKDLDPSQLLAWLFPEAKSERLEEGKEVITVDGKEYACTKVCLKVTGTSSVAPSAQTITCAFWFSADAPLHGLLRMTMEMQNNRVQVFELKGAGRDERLEEPEKKP
jgi:hypothetical protein